MTYKMGESRKMEPKWPRKYFVDSATKELIIISCQGNENVLLRLYISEPEAYKN